MAKISKRLLNKHNEAVELLKKDKLNFYEREFVYTNYHEGAGKMNNLISAHFTPYEIAKGIVLSARNSECFVDLCAGIGMLSYAMLRDYEVSHLKDTPPIKGICVENCTEYYEVGKKLLPEFHWICGDIFDQKVIDEIMKIMEGKQFTVISNPPYGRQVKAKTNGFRYSGPEFEYKAIELGAILGAYDGVFLIPDNSCPFRMTDKSLSGKVYDESYKEKKYIQFQKQTGIEIMANMGISTELYDEDNGWKDVSITTEIAIVEYLDLDYFKTTLF